MHLHRLEWSILSITEFQRFDIHCSNSTCILTPPASYRFSTASSRALTSVVFDVNRLLAKRTFLVECNLGKLELLGSVCDLKVVAPVPPIWAVIDHFANFLRYILFVANRVNLEVALAAR